MIEPTETEGKAELDLFADALISIAREIEEDPDLVLKAPYSTRTSKVDEVARGTPPDYPLEASRERRRDGVSGLQRFYRPPACI